MKIQKVKIEKFKVLENLEANLNGANILLIGDNGVGKSSFIQFIEIALGKQTNIPVNAEGEGHIVVDRNGQEYKFFVKFKGGKPTVTVETPDGFKDSRKSILASIVGAIDFDIDEFVQLSNSVAGRKKQVEIFKSFLDEETRNQLAKYEANVKFNYDQRTEIGKSLKEKEAVLNSSPYAKELSLDIKEVDVKAEVQRLSEATTHNANVDRIIKGLSEKSEANTKAKEKINQLKAELKALETSCENNDADIKKGNEWLVNNSKIDTGSIEKTINDATETNLKFQKIKELKESVKQIESLKSEQEDYTVKIELERQAIADTIRDMSTPVQGLAFDDEQLLYNSVPVSENNLSTSEIMELGIKLKMAENPEVGVLFLQKGESLGAKRYAEIIDLCNKNNFQLIMEQVERGKEKLIIELVS